MKQLADYSYLTLHVPHIVQYIVYMSNTTTENFHNVMTKWQRYTQKRNSCKKQNEKGIQKKKLLVSPHTCI